MKRLALAAPAVIFVFVAGFVAIAFSSQLGLWAYVLGVATAAGALGMVAYVTRDEPPTETDELNEIKAILQEQQSQLEKRELDLMNRLAVYHEWTEFPEPIDLATAPSDDELSALAEKDRELQTLLSETAEKLFNDIKENRYAPDGKVSIEIIRGDAQQLAENVARIYNPDADQMLLKTNIEDILRASSRACLQMLTVLDLLPVDVKRQNIDDLYAYVRRAVQAFGVYKAAEPYWGYVNSAYYLGRLALGANPLSMGAWWVAGRVGRQAGQHLTKRYLNRQAMTLVNHAIRVLGNEVACVYGSGYRHRDVNWIYAAELTELVAALPVSHRCLSHALREIGSLALRSEYDRVFLYRCIAEGLTAKPEQYRAAAVLTPTERQAAAQRLERFVNAYGGGASPKRLQKWISQAETRLEVQLHVSISAGSDDDREVQPQTIARSLMAFLVEMKGWEPDEAWRTVVDRGMVALDENDRQSFKAEWESNPAFFFELPDLAPASEDAKQLMQKLIDLSLQDGPRGASTAGVVANAAAYLRIEEKELEQLIADRGAELVANKTDGRPPKLTSAQIVPVLDWLDNRPDSLFLIGGLQAKWSQKPKTSGWDQLVLLGEPQALVAARIDEGDVELIWRGDRAEVTLDKGGYLSGSFGLRGGEWLASELANQPAPEQLTIRSGRFSRPSNSDEYKTLADWIEQQSDA